MIIKKLKEHKSSLFSIVLFAAASFTLAALVEILFFNSPLFHHDFYFVGIRFFSMAVLALLAALLIRYRHYFCAHLDKAFLAIVIPLGALFILVFPRTVYVSQDDQIHLQNAYIFLNTDDVAWSDAFRSIEMMSTSTDGLSWAETDALYDELNQVHAATVDQSFDFEEVSTPFSRLVYLPYYIGFTIARFSHFDFISMLTFAKFCNFLCYVFLMYFAIKVSTHARKIFFVFALLMPNLFFAAQFSYDPMITAGLALAAALFFRMLEDRQISPRYAFGFVLAVVWASLPKAIYCPFLLLLLFIPNRKFDHPRRAIAFKISAVVITLLLASTFILPLLTGSMPSDFRGGDTSVSGQLSYILRSPVRAGSAFVRFFTISLPTLFLDHHIVASVYQISEYTKYITPLVNLASIILLLATVFTSRKPREIYTRRVRFAILAAYFVIALAILAAMYLSFTPVGSGTIEGVQARYFLPILPLALIFLVPSTAKAEKPETTHPSFAFIALTAALPVLVLLTFILRASLF